MMNLADIQIGRNYITHCPPEWEWHHRGGEAAYIVWLATAGRGLMRTRGVDYPIVAGDCFLLRLEDQCDAWHEKGNYLTVAWMVFSGPPDVDMPRIHRRLSNLPFFRELLERAIRKSQGEAAIEGSAEDWLRMALAVLKEEDARPEVAGVEAEQREAIRRICERIRLSPGERYNVAGLAVESHYSPGHFTRLFERVVGQGPRAFITNARIDAARALLSMSSQSIAEIARSLGFSDAFHFSREFKRHAGVSPRAYRHKKPD